MASIKVSEKIGGKETIIFESRNDKIVAGTGCAPRTICFEFTLDDTQKCECEAQRKKTMETMEKMIDDMIEKYKELKDNGMA